MAELLGIIAGGAGLASLAVQLTESAASLKRFHHSYKHAAETLEDTAEEIDTFIELLQLLGDEREAFDGLDLRVLDQCKRICEKRTARIRSVVERLDNVIARSRRRGSFRTALEKDEIQRLSMELERSSGTLFHAYQLYAESRRRRQSAEYHSELLQQLTLVNSADRLSHAVDGCAAEAPSTMLGSSHLEPWTGNGLISLNDEDSEKASHSHEKTVPVYSPIRPRLRRRILTLAWRPWLASWIWEISVWQIWSGWTIHLRTCYLVPDDAPIIHFASMGNLQGVQKLIESGRAAPNCCLRTGRSIRQLAILSGNGDLCDYLLDQTPATDADHETLRSWLWRTNFEDTYDNILRKMHSAFLKRAEFDFEDLSTPDAFSWILRGGPPCLGAVEYALLELDPASLPMDVKLKAVWASSCLATSKFPSAFLEVLGVASVDRHVAAATTFNGMGVFHFIAFHLLECQLFRGPIHENEPLLVELVRALLFAGVDLHLCNLTGHTPLTFYIAVWLEELALFDRPHSSINLTAWASLLRDAGVNLSTYAAKERALWQEPVAFNRWTHFNLDRIRVTDLIAGPEAVDWKVIIRRKQGIPIYQGHAAPGAWPPLSSLPLTICWRPREVELLEGGWDLLRELPMPSRVLPVRSTPDTRIEGYIRSQDDAGKFALLLGKRSRLSLSRRRSNSQPAVDLIREHDQLAEDSWFVFDAGRNVYLKEAYSPLDSTNVPSHWWLPQRRDLHICNLGLGTRLVVGRPDRVGDFDHPACLENEQDVARILQDDAEDMVLRHRRHYETRLRAEQALMEIDA